MFQTISLKEYYAFVIEHQLSYKNDVEIKPVLKKNEGA